VSQLAGTVRHFDRRAAGYETFRRRWPLNMLQQEEETALRHLAHVEPEERVLDVGCGAGFTLEWLRQKRARAVGVDLSLRMASACSRAGHVACVQDMEALGFRAAFDWVLCVGSLEFVRDPQRAVRNFAQCLRPGGSLVLLFPRRGVLGGLYRLYHRSHGVPIQLFTAETITRLFVAAGLSEPTAMIHCRLSSLCHARRSG
jgi:SAM-dependent methyltransferase